VQLGGLVAGQLNSYTWASAQMGSADHPGKMDEKLKSENMQKQQFSMFMLYFDCNHGSQV